MTRRPRPLICIDCRYVRARPSGIGEVVAQLAAQSPGLAPEYDFLLLKHPEAPRLSDAGNVEERVVAHAANGPVTMWLLPRFVDLGGVALFHSPSNILPAGLTMPSVTTIHDLMWLTHPDWAAQPGWRGRIDRLFYRHGITRALRRSTRIATVSGATKAAIATFAPAAAARTRVTLSGVDAAFRPEAEVAPTNRHPCAGGNPDSPTFDLLDPGLRGGDGVGISSVGRRYILTVGQFARYKNHIAVLDAFARVAMEVPDLDLIFVQRQGAGSDTLGPRAAALGVADRVRFQPPLDRAALVRLYGGAVALCHPSLMEGFGNPLAEAMACGCPVVTSDCSAMPEVTGGAALLVDPTDVDAIAVALRRIATDPVLAADLRARGLERARALSWRAFAAANVALYRELLA